MKLFTVGPVEMYPETLKVASRQLPYFRTSQFSEVMYENDRLLKKSIGAENADKTVFLTASGTGAMEATVINCFSSEDRVLVINGGSFGERFAAICELHQIPYDEVKLDFGEILTQEKLDSYDANQYTGLLVNLHETSTGQLYDIEILSEYCQNHQMFLVVDAISAFGADTIEFTKHGIDALILSSQKALALSPGLSMVIISQRMYEKRVKRINSRSLYFDFNQHIRNMDRGQTPFTPAVGILLELQERLQSIEEVGIDEVQKKAEGYALRFRKELVNLGFEVPMYPLSNALTPIILEPYAEKMYQSLKEKHDIYVTPSGGALKDVLIRVGHLGNLVWDDYEELLIRMQEEWKLL